MLTRQRQELILKLLRKQLLAARQCYVICDYSKFDHVSFVTFAPFYGTTFIIDQVIAGYEECGNIWLAEEEITGINVNETG